MIILKKIIINLENNMFIFLYKLINIKQKKNEEKITEKRKFNFQSKKKTQLLNYFYYRLCKTTHLNKYIYI